MTKIIADACGNHLGNRLIIESMIEQAGNNGIDYIKFQAFYADKLSKTYPDYKNVYDRMKRNELSYADIEFIIDKCSQHNIKPLFTVIDTDTVDFLCKVGQQEFKIASSEAHKDWLIAYILSKGKKVFISTGMSTDKEIKSLRDTYNGVFFYCVSKYPANIIDIDYNKMCYFDGFSDHTQGVLAAMRAIDLGVKYIERHYTLGQWLPGTDHKFSSTPDEFRELVEYRNNVYKQEQYKRRWIP